MRVRQMTKEVIMNKINAPPEVLLEREKTNRALALRGWGPTLRLKFLRSPVATVALAVGGVGGVGALIHQILLFFF